MTKPNEPPSKPPSKLKQFICIPTRALSRFRDMYIKSMIGCASHYRCGGSSASGYPMFLSEYDRTSVFDSSDEDLRKLVRANEIRKARSVGRRGVGRSWSATAIGRIDEDRVCEFEDLKVRPLVVPRSRSFAIGSRMQGVPVCA